VPSAPDALARPIVLFAVERVEHSVAAPLSTPSAAEWYAS
jgi:hypothetical protein